MLNWKQNIGVSNLTPEKGKNLLKNFRYPTEIDEKGRLLIDAGMSKFVIAFQSNGPDSTLIGVSYFKMKLWAMILLILSACALGFPALIVALIINSKRKAVFIEAVRLMNQNINQVSANSSTANDLAPKLKKLKSMLDEKLISQEDFTSKKNTLLAQY